MTTFYIKEGDTSPAIEYMLSPVTITLNGGSVVFNMKDRRNQLKVNRAAAVITDDGLLTDTPTVQYNWTAADTDTAGTYYGEFEVTYADSTIETFPNNGYITVEIRADIA